MIIISSNKKGIKNVILHITNFSQHLAKISFVHERTQGSDIFDEKDYISNKIKVKILFFKVLKLIFEFNLKTSLS